ncbi:uncharacterized protein Tco025E_01421 [Trypanosoma conorhini]|uniref:Uncharacterized protein n=1 Tax=Trypanosoma conorhini TaxID=83891 RepID=A0A422Q9K6_9TRYP|nr:uncharacterized protein Tco025E_01421 [Trypanosoma conorhini]RNF26629.1 hypothetical protein Tco025E_01421 [Trypanosoma conorhini]
MLRLCLRQLCRAPAPRAGESVGACLTSSSHCDGEPALLARLLAPFVPFTFTALTQISRGVDGELMERVAEAGGLRSLLASHPELFSVSTVGSVYVARRLRRCRAAPTSSVDGAAPRCCQEEADTQPAEQQLQRRGAVDSFPKIERVPLEVFRLFPTFFVPTEALLTQLRGAPPLTPSNSASNGTLASDVDPNTVPEAFEHSLIEKYKEFLDVVVVKDTNVEGGGAQSKGFLRLRRVFAARAASYEAEQLERAGSHEECISHIMEPYRVEEYEQYRVARLIPVAEKLVPISVTMQHEAAALLPEGRCLIHVLVSAPELFQVQNTPELSVRFILDSRFRPKMKYTKAEVERQLAEIKESRVKNGLKMPIDRKKRRALTRQLQFCVNPTPYLDERVWAYALLDVLPTDGPLLLSHALSGLPREMVACAPPNMHRLYSEYKHLFLLVQGDRERMLQRADVPEPEQRPVSSVDTEEILLEIYNQYPRRRHPNSGTCLGRCMYSMPALLRARLRQLDFVEDVLRKHPDKVEVLGVLDEELARGEHFLVNRPQMLQLFRFVGEYQTELVRRYEALCAKLGQSPDKEKLV